MLETPYLKKDGQEDEESSKNDFEAKQNLLRFFDLLLKVDKRNNPERYKKPSNTDKEIC